MHERSSTVTSTCLAAWPDFAVHEVGFRVTSPAWTEPEVSGARGGADGFELAERVTRLGSDMLTLGAPERGTHRSSTSAVRRRLADTARAVLTDDPASLGLRDVANHVGASPCHLSRVFRAETGMTLTRFRARLRVRLALDRIAAGERDLASLAADLGFADHAHLTRTVRQEVGAPPTAVRRLLVS